MTQTTREYGDWPLKRLMTEVVGSGHKSADDMNRAQAREAFQRILDGEPDDTTLGAFWLANRWKRNTPEELAAFVDVMREESVQTAAPDADPVDCGANYDGKHSTAILGVAAGVVAAAAGTPVVVHSGDRVPTQKADAYKHVLDELGVTTDPSPARERRDGRRGRLRLLLSAGVQPRRHRPVRPPRRDGRPHLRQHDGDAGQPADADVHLGVSTTWPSPNWMIRTFQACESQSVERALFFQGMEGYDDIRPGSTVVAEWPSENTDADDEGIYDFEIRTSEYGADLESEDLEVDDVAADSAAITEAVVAGETGEWFDDDEAFEDAVALNAALRMYAREDVPSLDEGMEQARAVVADGSAADVLR